VSEPEVADCVQELGELLVALRDGGPELGAVDVEVVQQTLEIVLRVSTDRGGLDAPEDSSNGLVEVLVVASPLPDVGEEVLRQDVEPFLLGGLLAAELGVRVRQVAVVEVGVASRSLLLVEVGGEVLGDKPIEEHPEDVGLEVLAVDVSAQFVGDAPDGPVELRPLRFFRHPAHGQILAAWPTVSGKPCGRVTPDCD
jgi:hypothetical protein